MKQNGKDSVKKLVKSTLERYSSGNVNAQTLKNILGAKGYTVIRYSALDVSEETERLMSTLGVTEISRQTDSFTYLDNVRRIVFIRKDISDDEFLYLLALELGRILTTSFRGSCIVSGNSQDEAEAREFAYHVTDIARHGIFYNISKFYPIQTVIVSAVLASFIIVFACVSLALPGLYGKNALQNDTNQELAVSAISRGVEDSSKPNQQAEDLSAPENPTAVRNTKIIRTALTQTLLPPKAITPKAITWMAITWMAIIRVVITRPVSTHNKTLTRRIIRTYPKLLTIPGAWKTAPRALKTPKLP